MKKITYISFILLLFSGCSKIFLGEVPPNDPESVFESFCQQINENYSGKDVRPVNWDSLYKVYRLKVTPQTTDAQLIAIFRALIEPFKDRHLTLIKGNFTINPASENNVINGKPDYVNIQAVENGLKKRIKNYKYLFSYEKTSENIGYIAINSFEQREYSATDYDFFDTILEELKDTKSLIIDVRTNSGGDERYAKLMAGRFATTAQLYKYRRTKIGVNKEDYSDFSSSTLQPRGAWTYTKPVVLLTGRYTYSTANNFTMMLRTLPNVTTLGNATGDGVVGYIARELPNGWLLHCPSGLAYLPDKTLIEGSGGIKPKIEALISEEDKKNGRDAILEKALAFLR
jgi:carboxyl-terminal processing protease